MMTTVAEAAGATSADHLLAAAIVGHPVEKPDETERRQLAENDFQHGGLQSALGSNPYGSTVSHV
jgi:hypothetical protein